MFRPLMFAFRVEIQLPQGDRGLINQRTGDRGEHSGSKQVICGRGEMELWTFIPEQL